MLLVRRVCRAPRLRSGQPGGKGVLDSAGNSRPPWQTGTTALGEASPCRPADPKASHGIGLGAQGELPLKGRLGPPVTAARSFCSRVQSGASSARWSLQPACPDWKQDCNSANQAEHPNLRHRFRRAGCLGHTRPETAARPSAMASPYDSKRPTTAGSGGMGRIMAIGYEPSAISLQHSAADVHLAVSTNPDSPTAYSLRLIVGARPPHFPLVSQGGNAYVFPFFP